MVRIRRAFIGPSLRVLFAILAVSSTVWFSACTRPSPLPGSAPPPLQVARWLQAPDGFDARWASLKGKVVVVEFWATWCGPCVAAIPHLNKLAEEFRGQDVVFLAVTDDSEDRVKAFLDAQPTEAVIGIDAGRKTGKAFGAATIPHTVIVGKDGRVIGVTYPEHVTADVIREALAGKSPVFPLKGRGP